jgi:hypothetical protein
VYFLYTAYNPPVKKTKVDETNQVEIEDDEEEAIPIRQQVRSYLDINLVRCKILTFKTAANSDRRSTMVYTHKNSRHDIFYFA